MQGHVRTMLSHDIPHTLWHLLQFYWDSRLFRDSFKLNYFFIRYGHPSLETSLTSYWLVKTSICICPHLETSEQATLRNYTHMNQYRQVVVSQVLFFQRWFFPPCFLLYMKTRGEKNIEPVMITPSQRQVRMLKNENVLPLSNISPRAELLNSFSCQIQTFFNFSNV